MNQFYLEGIKPEIQKFYRIHYLILMLKIITLVIFILGFNTWLLKVGFS